MPRTLLIVACCLTAIRVLAPFEVDIDQAVQIEAAERLATGRGLTSTYFGSHPLDLAKPAIAEKLTWFPPGFSLLVAAFLSCGVPLAAALRMLYVSVTLAGWWGWARIFRLLLAQQHLDGERPWGALGAVALLAPVFFTPAWTGTDVFLWAALPYVIVWLRKEQTHPYRRAAAAGVLIGGLYSIRYAAAFLMATGAVLIVQASLPHFRTAASRVATFVAALLVGIVPTTLYLARVSERELPGYVQPVSASDFATAVHQIGVSLPATSIGIIGSPLVFKLSETIHSSLLSYAIGLACCAALVLLPLVASRSLSPPNLAPQANLATSLALIPLTLASFLTVMTVLAPLDGQALLGIARYYVPVSLCGVLLFSVLSRASSGDVPLLMGKAVLALLVVYYCAYLPAAAVIRKDYVTLSRTVIGITPPRSDRYISTSEMLSFPSGEVYSVKRASRAKIEELHRRFPDAVFVVENYHHYVYGWTEPGAPAPGRDLRRFLQPHTSVRRGDAPRVPGAVVSTGLDFWRAAHVSRALRVFWVMNSPDAVQFLPSANRHLVFHDPYERTTIFVSQFSAGEAVGRGLTTAYVAARSLN
ncbi:MAG: hypothetical protein EHM55_21845 [Acidobacteria bacterium]|nr:MAG: hypothetical protein EHM55_21845 [Acidobacteriota bacterium]